MATTGAPAAQVAIIREGRIVFERAFGVRRVGGSAATIHTRFEIGSLTKQFTAAAILQLKERGNLRLDDRVAKFLPGFPHASELTIRELLNQTTGLPDFTAATTLCAYRIPRRAVSARLKAWWPDR
jgi:D-alanyl-D-alanine carboxypeptidase